MTIDKNINYYKATSDKYNTIEYFQSTENLIQYLEKFSFIRSTYGITFQLLTNKELESINIKDFSQYQLIHQAFTYLYKNDMIFQNIIQNTPINYKLY